MRVAVPLRYSARQRDLSDRIRDLSAELAEAIDEARGLGLHVRCEFTLDEARLQILRPHGVWGCPAAVDPQHAESVIDEVWPSVRSW